MLLNFGKKIRNRIKKFLSQSQATPTSPPADEISQLQSFLLDEGFLEGYGVQVDDVAIMKRIKNETGGEPVRVGSYTRGKLGMKDLEVLFTLRSISRYVPKGGKVMDIASGSSLLPSFFISMGYNGYHHDVHPCSYSFPGLDQIACEVSDIGKHYQSGFFDAVTLICAMEHFGLGRYGDKIDGTGDYKAIDALYEVLKPKGILVVTVPFGPPSVIYNTHRVYNYERLKNIFCRFKILNEEYRSWPEWEIIPRQQAESITLIPEGKRVGKNHSLALWILEKMPNDLVEAP